MRRLNSLRYKIMSRHRGEEQRRRIACTLVLVAAADGTLVREEMAAIESAMGAMLLHPESRSEVRQLLTSPPELESILEGMEIAAIAFAYRAGVHRITAPPTFSGFVVFDGIDDV